MDNSNLPSGNLTLLWKIAIYSGFFPLNICFFHNYVDLYRRVVYIITIIMIVIHNRSYKTSIITTYHYTHHGSVILIVITSHNPNEQNPGAPRAWDTRPAWKAFNDSERPRTSVRRQGRSASAAPRHWSLRRRPGRPRFL